METIKLWKLMVVLVGLVVCVNGPAEAEILEVPAYGTPTVTSSMVLQEGHWYLLEDSNTYVWWGTGQTRADAEWYDGPYDDPCDPWLEFSPDPCDGPSVLDLLINGTGQNWRGTADAAVDNNSIFLPHTYSPSHIYRLEWLGTGEKINFKIEDGTGSNPFDNSGSLWVELSPMTIKLRDPDGGENLVAGNTYDIMWQTVNDANIANVMIELSANNGQNWNDVNTVANSASYEWLVPEVTSNQCLVRISDANDANIYDTSDDVFTIFQCQAQYAGDLDGDCYVDFYDFALFAADWLECGNPLDPICTINNGLMAYWSFDEGSGRIAHDSVGDNDGNLVGDPNWVDGISGNALDFNGVGDYVSTRLLPPTGNSPRTILFWAKTRESTKYMVGTSYGGGSQNYGVSFKTAFNYACEGATIDVSMAAITYSSDVNDGMWHFYAWVVPEGATRLNEVKVSMDGIELTEIGCGLSMTTLINTTSESLFEIGTYYSDCFFDGTIDEVRVYNRALTAMEIQYLHENP